MAKKDKKDKYVGIAWHIRLSKWQAYIDVGGKKIFLGYYENIEDAKAARKQAEGELRKARE